jgi:hypothetical protein
VNINTSNIIAKNITLLRIGIFMISRRTFIRGCFAFGAVAVSPVIQKVPMPLETIEMVVEKTPLVAVEGGFAIIKHLGAVFKKDES